jgi:quinol monooxygenase YgiN
VLLVCRFRPGDRDRFVERAERALRLLSAQPGCLDATLAQATDDPGAWLLVARFASVAAYRRALSPFDVREHVVPLLAEALADEPAGYEPLLHAAGGELTRHASLIARDAGTVGIGEAAGPSTPR